MRPAAGQRSMRGKPFLWSDLGPIVSQRTGALLHFCRPTDKENPAAAGSLDADVLVAGHVSVRRPAMRR